MLKGKKAFIKAIMMPALMAITTVTAKAEDMSPVEIGTKYYDAFYASEYNVVRSVASPDMVFVDPTAPENSGIPSRVENLEDLIAFMASVPTKVEVTYTDKYASNGQVILKVQMNGTAPAELMGDGKEGQARFTIDGVSILHVVDGKVIQHSDYMNYSAMKVSLIED